MSSPRTSRPMPLRSDSGLNDGSSFGGIAAIWCIWALLMALALAMTSCKDPNFRGKANDQAQGAQQRPPNAGGLGDPNNPGGGNPAGGPPAGGTPAGGGGISTTQGNSDVLMVPMRIRYNSKESASGGYEGRFQITLKQDTGVETQVLDFKAGEKNNDGVVVPAACKCGKNNIDLLISADGQRRNLQGWRVEVMTSHNPPDSGSDWQDWLDRFKNKPQGPNAVYLGGFDHIFIFGASCGKFACDTRKWNNRDDTKMIFTCEIDQCPQKDQGVELNFIGMDP